MCSSMGKVKDTNFENFLRSLVNLTIENLGTIRDDTTISPSTYLKVSEKKTFGQVD